MLDQAFNYAKQRVFSRTLCLTFAVLTIASCDQQATMQSEPIAPSAETGLDSKNRFPTLAAELSTTTWLAAKVDVPYNTASVNNTLDLLTPDRPGPHPTVIMYHGGGWIKGTPANVAPLALAFLHAGWAVAIVKYRLGPEHPAPAAVFDARCAAHWVFTNAVENKLDQQKIVAFGVSAGGHLAMMTAFGDVETIPGYSCPNTNENIEIAATVNIFGIADVADVLHGPNKRDYVLQWFDNVPEDEQLLLAQLLSPINHIAKTAPPILTVHGGNDGVVPYQQAVALHAALNTAGVENKLITIEDGRHGQFGRKKTQYAYHEVQTFLSSLGLWPATRAE